MSWNRIVPPWLDAVDLTPRVNAVQTRVTTANTKIDNDLIPKVNSITELSDITRDSVVLGTGTSVVSGAVGSVANVEIEGHTLTSLANSNLEAGKQYVLADKKTKVVVDGNTQTGVAKFTKGTTTISTANFVGKVNGSTVANPHIFKRYGGGSVGLISPGAGLEDGLVGNITTLNGTVYTLNRPELNNQAQHLFSFDLISEIERKLGIIPKTTLAEKVQWVKDNVHVLTVRWYGFGFSAGVNKASLGIWSGTAWAGIVTHSNSTPFILAKGQDFVTYPADKVFVGADGFVHYLAYSEPSDGATPSSLSTDYIELEVKLQSTAQLNTRPTIIRIENFEGKVVGSTVENPHVLKSGAYSTLTIPSVFTFEPASTNITTLNGLTFGANTSVNGAIAQQLFSFNLIEAVERSIGKIPRSSTTDKAQWLRDNIRKFNVDWSGFGSSVGGIKAYFTDWRQDTLVWSSPQSHTNSSVTKISNSRTSFFERAIGADGFAHWLAYADPSDGVTASVIHSDYIELEIELKPTADFSRPKVPLYEVTADYYSKILVDWNTDAVISRYPAVEGTQHIQGLGIVAEGENLLPPFTELSFTSSGDILVNGAYDITLSGNNYYAETQGLYTLSPSTTYNLSLTQEILSGNYCFNTVLFYNNSTYLGEVNIPNIQSPSGSYSSSFTTPSTCNKIVLRFARSSAIRPYSVRVKDVMLTLGSTAKPFVPRDPSYLYADVKLGAIGTVSDRFYEQDGQKMVRKAVEKDVVLDGSQPWLHNGDKTNSKEFILLNLGMWGALVTKYNGLLLPFGSLQSECHNNSAGSFRLTAFDSDTGFGEAYSPSQAEIKAYFYGWKMNNGTFNTNYESTGTKTWIPIGDVSNARAVTTCPTSASPTQVDGTIQPYKLSYVLTTPQIVNVSDKVEGSLKVNGSTQVSIESGLVVREKVVPQIYSGVYKISSTYNGNYGLLSKKNHRILAVYKNGIEDKLWTISNDVNSFGKQHAVIPQSSFDSTAEYSVTYIALDKHLLTNNPLNVKLSYAKNIRTSVNDLLGKSEDSSASISVQSRLLVDILARLKAGGI